MKRSSEVSDGGEPTGSDLSILRKPIQTSVTGFNEARKAYEDGTEEVIHRIQYSPARRIFN